VELCFFLPDLINTNLGTLETDVEANTALLTTIDGDTSTIAGDTTSLDAKTPALGTAAMAASTPVTIATDDTMMAPTVPHLEKDCL